MLLNSSYIKSIIIYELFKRSSRLEYNNLHSFKAFLRHKKGFEPRPLEVEL